MITYIATIDIYDADQKPLTTAVQFWNKVADQAVQQESLNEDAAFARLSRYMTSECPVRLRQYIANALNDRQSNVTSNREVALVREELQSIDMALNRSLGRLENLPFLLAERFESRPPEEIIEREERRILDHIEFLTERRRASLTRSDEESISGVSALQFRITSISMGSLKMEIQVEAYEKLLDKSGISRSGFQFLFEAALRKVAQAVFSADPSSASVTVKSVDPESPSRTTTATKPAGISIEKYQNALLGVPIILAIVFASVLGFVLVSQYQNLETSKQNWFKLGLEQREQDLAEKEAAAKAAATTASPTEPDKGKTE